MPGAAPHPGTARHRIPRATSQDSSLRWEALEAPDLAALPEAATTHLAPPPRGDMPKLGGALPATADPGVWLGRAVPGTSLLHRARGALPEGLR